MKNVDFEVITKTKGKIGYIHTHEATNNID